MRHYIGKTCCVSVTKVWIIHMQLIFIHHLCNCVAINNVVVILLIIAVFILCHLNQT